MTSTFTPLAGLVLGTLCALAVFLAIDQYGDQLIAWVAHWEERDLSDEPGGRRP